MCVIETFWRSIKTKYIGIRKIDTYFMYRRLIFSVFSDQENQKK